ncbi:MAG: FkbM family methyltransferase [Crocinitomicaceae bacterium]|nr:FkbM family methyltransferase [Crocinitomicaceae bacterium]
MLNKLSPYTFAEKLKIIRYSIGSKLISGVPKHIQRNYVLTNRLLESHTGIDGDAHSLKFSQKINNKEFKFDLKKVSSDADVFGQIILEEEYKSIVSLLKESNDQLNIIDCGANIGLTSLYLKAFYPNAKIVCLEPSEDTSNRMINNFSINGYDDINVLKKGLWSTCTKLKGDDSFRDGLDWSFRLVPAKPDEDALFETTTVSDIIKDHAMERIDFLKIDIEGGEEDVFSEKADLSWLDVVDLIAIEIHDEFDCRERIESVLRSNNFTITYSGELTIGKR